MIFLLGFRSPNSDEVPEILYVGNDGDALNRIAEGARHPRLAKMVNPPLYPIRHWSEEAAAAFESATQPSAVTDTPAAAEPAPSETAAAASAEPAPAAEVADADDGPTLGDLAPATPKKRGR